MISKLEMGVTHHVVKPGVLRILPNTLFRPCAGRLVILLPRECQRQIVLRTRRILFEDWPGGREFQGFFQAFYCSVKVIFLEVGKSQKIMAALQIIVRLQRLGEILQRLFVLPIVVAILTLFARRSLEDRHRIPLIAESTGTGRPLPERPVNLSAIAANDSTRNETRPKRSKGAPPEQPT